jgi:sulfoxide reductase heme-binding subunit YedZ
VKRVLKPLLFVLCLAPLAWIGYELYAGRIRGEWIKEITHRTGFWGLVMITATLAVTPLRRLSRWNALAGYRRMLGLFGFTYITIHLLIYVVLDRQLPFDPLAWREIGTDIAKRPYITVGFTGWLLMVPLALTSTKGWIRRLGRKWTALHSLVYFTGLAGVVHFMWSVKADVAVPTRFALVLVALLAIRLLPKRTAAGRAARAVPDPPRIMPPQVPPEPLAPAPSPRH